ncbi:LysR family transcriptional regulator [Streptomyces diastatochromogenes]|nr:LysR family transcriptional regulator [Streptomyces diastatochromogenes]
MLFRQLEYLVALSRERHFARAAQACHVSQPALSEAVRKLEDEFGVPLVLRGRRYEGLTPEGERIVVWAQRLLADRDALKSEVGALRTGLSGRMRIGSVPTASGAVALLTAPFCLAHPLVTVEVATDLRAEDVLRQLRDFEIDAGVTYLHNGLPENFRAVPLYEERYVLLTGAADAPADRTTATWAEASRLPLCLLTGTMQGRQVLDGLFAEAGVRPSRGWRRTRWRRSSPMCGPAAGRHRAARLAARLRGAARHAGGADGRAGAVGAGRPGDGRPGAGAGDGPRAPGGRGPHRCRRRPGPAPGDSVPH